jgi:hypothetical protein
MTWLIAWIVLSVPCALFFAAFISLGAREQNDQDSAYDLGSELHDQTFVG